MQSVDYHPSWLWVPCTYIVHTLYSLHVIYMVVTNIKRNHCRLLHSGIYISNKERRHKVFRFNLVTTRIFYIDCLRIYCSHRLYSIIQIPHYLSSLISYATIFYNNIKLYNVQKRRVHLTEASPIGFVQNVHCILWKFEVKENKKYS